MKTSYSNLVQTEKFLRNELPPEESLVLQAKAVVDSGVRKNIFFHRMVHRLVLLYGRKKTKADIEAMHIRLLNTADKPAFRDRILKIFNP